MSLYRPARVATRALLLALSVNYLTAGSAAAKAHVKKPQPPVQAPSPIDSAPSSLPGAVSSARFFTINEVLANREGRTNPTQSWAMAAPLGQVTDAPLPSSSKLKSTDGPFGMLTFRAPEGPLWVKWREVEAGIDAEKDVLSRCRADLNQCASQGARRFLSIEDQAHDRAGRARIDTINRSINDAIRYTSDIEQHGVVNVWMTPLAALSTGRGDCKDYAIAKYEALHEAGIAMDDLQLLIVHDRLVHQDHAVVAVRDEGHWLILDNRHSVLQQDTEIHQYTLLFAIDYQGVKLFAAPYAMRLLLEGDTDGGPNESVPDVASGSLTAAAGSPPL